LRRKRGEGEGVLVGFWNESGVGMHVYPTLLVYMLINVREN